MAATDPRNRVHGRTAIPVGCIRLFGVPMAFAHTIDRAYAQRLVDSVTGKRNQYAAVTRDDAADLLGDRMAMLLTDKIRNLGPTPDTIYPWNVVDYLSQDDPRKRRP